MHARRSLSALLALVLSSAAVPAARGDDLVVAQTLFDEGRALAAEGKCEEASAKFRASLKVTPTVGAELNLADCSEKLGKLATAWAHFVDAAALAKRKNDDREGYARDRAAALAPKLAHLTLTAKEIPEGLEVRRDGARIDAAAFGVAVPIDAGMHVVEATAPGRRPMRADVSIAADGANVAFEIPALEPVAPEVAPESTTIASSAWSTQRVGAIVVGGAGVAAVGVGVFFGLRARSRWNDALSTCGSLGCTASGAAEGRDAARDGRISTISFAVAGAALVGASILWLTAPRRSIDVAPAIGPGYAGVGVGGAF